MSAKLPDTLEMIRRLVSVPSVSSPDPALDRSNRPVVDLLAEWAEGVGFEAEVLAVPGHEGKHNLVARLGSGDGGLVLSGHTDTVPYDEGRWTSDPFEAAERDGRLYGLGTADMKSFLALALEAASSFAAGDLKEPVTILATADEETGMFGARALVDAGRRLGRRAVIGEPTSLVPIRMHKGVMMEAIELVGRSGHSSNPALGVSALEGMRKVLDEIVYFRERMQAENHEPAFAVDVPTLNLGKIRGGDAANRICASCELQIDVRLHPGMDPATLRSELRERIARVVEGSGLELDVRPMFESVPPFSTPEDAEIVRAVAELTGEAPGTVAFGTEGPFLSELGLETVVCGPGSIDVAHQPDECLPLASIEPTVELLRGLVRRFCVDGADG